MLHDASYLANAVIVSLKWLSHKAQGEGFCLVNGLYPCLVQEGGLGMPAVLRTAARAVFAASFLVLSFGI